ncbi:MAG: Hsp20/alpha crystallin family protein [Leptolyngbyaceae bacterium]|nr:Hsp20/alpha crystallin family protein [Leptolyngbyaceae bacterium]
MLVRYWQPWREIETLRRQFDQVFDGLTQLSDVSEDRTWTPAIELKATDDHIVIRAQLPGIDIKDLDVQVTREAVSLAGKYQSEAKSESENFFQSEFRYGRFQRVIGLPVAVDNTQVQADYKDGILKLTLPKAPEVRNQVVKVNLTELQSTSPASETSLPAGENA